MSRFLLAHAAGIVLCAFAIVLPFGGSAEAVVLCGVSLAIALIVTTAPALLPVALVLPVEPGRRTFEQTCGVALCYVVGLGLALMLFVTVLGLHAKLAVTWFAAPLLLQGVLVAAIFHVLTPRNVRSPVTRLRRASRAVPVEVRSAPNREEPRR